MIDFANTIENLFNTVSIPFELHITVDSLSETQLETFIAFCNINDVKPLLIELAKGDFVQQPMLGKTITAASLTEALNAANVLSEELQGQAFKVKRLKIEVPSACADAFAEVPSEFARYFEWHGKTYYINPDELIRLCERHKAHLSTNALRDDGGTRFITLRDYNNMRRFRERIDSLNSDLNNGGWHLIKQESEYCIYDSNSYLDNGWLPK